MPAQRPRASFEPLPPGFNLGKLVETTDNFDYVVRIACDTIDQQGVAAFEKLVLLHVIIGGKPLVIDGFEDRLDPWTFTPKWLRDNCGEKVEEARVLTTKNNLPLTIGHYLKNMGKLTNQFFDKQGAYKEKNRQRVYLKDIDCPDVWQNKLKEHIPAGLFYMNESTGDAGGPGAVPETNGPLGKLGKGIGRAGDLMSSLPADMRADNLMCYIGHEGTYTPAHREMCASLGQNIMVEASNTVSDDGKAERPGSSIWFMTESKDRHIVSEYWLSVLGHDIEVEDHFAQAIAWKKAPFNVYVVEQRPGDLILIPPLAPHQVWNRGTRTMKVAWNRTTLETLEMAINEALPRSRVVCRDEQYKNKAIIYYTLQKYANLLSFAQQQASQMTPDAVRKLLYTGKVKALQKDFKRLFSLYRQILLSEMFNPDDREAPKSPEYLPFDGNVTCAYCRGNIFNRFLTCGSCKDMLGHSAEDDEGDPYDVCMDCYAMGRSCGCISNLKWVEQFRWKELASKYDGWRQLIISLEGGINEKTPQYLLEEKKRYGKKSLAEVCEEQLKRRPWNDVHKALAPKDDEDEEEEIVVDDNGMVKKITKKKTKTFLKNNSTCHVCCKRHPNWKMAFCGSCERGWCYGSLFRGWDKMPMEIMEDLEWSCPHCLGICFAGACRREGKMTPYEPKGTLLGHDTKKVADVRSVEALVDFSVSNLTWLKDDDAVNRTESSRVKRARAEAEKAKEQEPAEHDDDDHQAQDVDQSRVDYEYTPPNEQSMIDPSLMGNANENEDDLLARRLQQANSSFTPIGSAYLNARAPEGYAPLNDVGYVPEAPMYPQPGVNSYNYPDPMNVDREQPSASTGEVNGLRPFKRPRMSQEGMDNDNDDINMQKHPKAKKPKMTAAGFRSSDLADGTISKAKNEAQRQFEKEKERKALEKAKGEGRFIMLQAALRGKKRIVELKLTGHRLAQFAAQETARLALRGNAQASSADNADEDAQDGEDDDIAEMSLLQSDIVPKKPKDQALYYKQRERDGFVITSKTKKARIPVERDENYGYRPGGRASKADASAPRKSRHNRAVDYEEVDIGSDSERDEAIITSPKEKEKRVLPEYLQNRHADDGDMPEELPDDYRDRMPKTQPAPAPAPTPAPAVEPPKKRFIGRPAGKRPSMRPPAPQPVPTVNISDGEDNSTTPHDDFADVDDVIAAIPSFMDPEQNASNDQQSIDESNRLAKLQALEMLEEEESANSSSGMGPPGMAGRGTGKRPVMTSMADVIPDDDDDDGADNIPAR